MPVTEESRHRLHQKLDQTIGPEDATTLMEHLPPTGWADVATKHDLIELERRVDLRFENVDTRFDMVDRRFVELDRRLDERFDMVDRRFVDLDRRFDELDRRFVAADRRQESLEQRMDALIHEMVRHTWQVVGFIAVIAGLLMAAAKYL